MAAPGLCGTLVVLVLMLQDSVQSFRERGERSVSPKFRAGRAIGGVSRPVEMGIRTLHRPSGFEARKLETEPLTRADDISDRSDTSQILDGPDETPIFPSAIVGGKSAPRKENPWQAALFEEDDLDEGPFCGGSLISTRFVLTAAHCMYYDETFLIFFREKVRYDESELVVSLGMYDWSKEESSRKNYGVRNIILHDGYGSRSNDDIALLELDSEVELGEYIDVIRLPPPNAAYHGQTARISGWGLLEHKGKQPKELQSVYVKLFRCDDNDEYANGVCCWGCNSREVNRIYTDREDAEKDFCNCDSGGALTVENPETQQREIIGVAEKGDCGRYDEDSEVGSGEYMKVTYYLRWIRDKTER